MLIDCVPPNRPAVCAEPAAALDVAADVYELWLSALTPSAISRRMGLPFAAVHTMIEARLALRRARIAQYIAAL